MHAGGLLKGSGRRAGEAERPPRSVPRRVFVNAALWPRALAVGKTQATTLTLALFVLGLTLDDLHVVRAPMAYVGALAAVLVFAFTPPVFARRLLLRLQVDAPADPAASLEGALSRRRALLGLVVVLTVAWLVLFSSGRTPRW